MLESLDLTVRLGGHTAVNAVSCRFEPGTLTAIVGPRGAGKTTYFNLLSGHLPATSGRVLLDGRDLTHAPAAERVRAGIGRAFELTRLFPSLSVREHVRLAVQARQPGPHRRGFDLWSVWSDHTPLMQRAEEILAAVALDERADAFVYTLSHGDQRRLEIAVLMAMDPRVYLLDEPTAGMSEKDAPVVLEWVRRIKRDPSRIVVLVEHRLDVIRELADRLVVLHHGSLVADGDPASVLRLPLVQETFRGHLRADDSARPPTAPPSESP